MTYFGKIANGVVVLEEDAALPEGTRVKVEPVRDKADGSDLDPIYRIAELAVDTGISDLSLNVDHYLYGHPKVSNGGK